MNRTRIASLIFLAGIFLLGIQTAWAGTPITFKFEGKIGFVVDTVAIDCSGGADCTTFRGSFTFDPTAPDIFPERPTQGEYRFNDPSLTMTVTIGNTTLTIPMLFIGVVNNGAASSGGLFDSYSVEAFTPGSDVFPLGLEGDIQLTQRVLQGEPSLTTSKLLPLTPPDLTLTGDNFFSLVNFVDGDPLISNSQVTKLILARIDVAIDIKPGTFPNSINLSSAGVIPVAILSSATFNATTRVNPNTISLAGAKVKMMGKTGNSLCHSEDVNGDGLLDLVCQVNTAQFIIEIGESIAVLEAETFDGTAVRGEDSVRIVPN